MKRTEKEFKNHNRAQIDYFSGTIKRTMVPAPTPYLLRHIDELVRFANIKPGDRVIEVGCGMGRYTLNIADRGIDIEGLDLTPFLLDRLREYDGGRHNIPLHCADVLDLPPELCGRFDAVIGFFVLHHFHDVRACFESMARLVRPGGTIIFLEPNAINPLYYVQILTTPGMTWKGDGGIVKMRKGLIFNAMRGAGLTGLELLRFGFFPPFIYNRQWGERLDHFLERAPFLKPFLPFQLFKGVKSER